MLQSVRSTKQYRFKGKSELRCMIREWGSPILSCLAVPSLSQNYLRKVNNAPPSCNIGKLCTEDPISVSRKFSLKFHSFYQRVLMKGKCLVQYSTTTGTKIYQARGAPHYHILRIKDTPVIGQDDLDQVLEWTQE